MSAGRRLCARRYPAAELLRSVPGVRSIVSFSYLLTIDDPKRFEGCAVGAVLWCSLAFGRAQREVATAGGG